MRHLSLAILTATMVGNATASHAQGLRAVRPLSGYTCMSLNLSPDRIRDPSTVVPVRQSPVLNAPIVAGAASTMIVPAPPRVTNGFIQVLRLNGQLGWMQTNALRPWKSRIDPSAECVPSLMSDGKPGFNVKRVHTQR